MSGLLGLLPYGDEEDEDQLLVQPQTSSDILTKPTTLTALPSKVMSISVQSAPLVHYKVHVINFTSNSVRRILRIQSRAHSEMVL